MEFPSRLTAALEYASRGIPVFPLKPGTKEPVFNGSFYDATVDHDTIRGWFETIGDCNIGYEPERIGCGLVDIDTKSGVDGRDAWFELRGDDKAITPTVVTPSGGLHYLYKGSLPGSHNALGEGIDTRGRKSYGVLPPSRLDEYGGEEYTWLTSLDEHPIAPMPAKVVEFWANRRTNISRLEAPEGLVLDRPWNIARAEIELHRLIDVGYVAGPGNRDVPCFQVACTMLEFGLSIETAAALIHDVWEPECNGLCANVPDLVERKLLSAAKPGGMQNAVGCRALMEPDKVAAQIEEATAAEKAPTAPRVRRFTARTPSQGAARPPMTYWDDWREKRYMPKLEDGCTIVLYGPEGSHKSGVLLKELVDVALRKGAKVLYVAAEGALGIDTARLPAILRSRGLPLTALDDRWLTVDAAPDLLDPVDVKDFLADFAEFRPDFVVFDTGTRCLGASDIDSTAAGTAAIKAMEAIARPWSATVFYVTHPGKDKERGAIGSKQQENQAFGRIWIEYDGQGKITLTVQKMKDGLAQFSVPMRVNTDGVPVVVELSPDEVARLSRTQEALHDDLRDAVWSVMYPLLQRGDKASRTDHGRYGPAYVLSVVNEMDKFKGINRENVIAAMGKLERDGWLAPEGNVGYVLGSDARAPTSMG